MNRIFKYALTHEFLQKKVTIDLPEGYKILRLGMQRGWAVFWAEVDPNAPTVSVTFIRCLTGDPVPDGVVRYIGTMQDNSDASFEFVTHWYEEIVG